MPEIVENFLPIGDFQHFAYSAMTAPYYVPCDFCTKTSEADGSIACFGEDGPPETKFNELMFQMLILNRLGKQNRCVVNDFYFEHFQAIDCIRELLNVKRFHNLRLGCTPVQSTRYMQDYHVDQCLHGTEHCKTALLYLNSNNGGTSFKDGNTFVQSKANRLVKFPVKTPHALVCSTDTKLRYVLNINYEEFDSEPINYE